MHVSIEVTPAETIEVDSMEISIDGKVHVATLSEFTSIATLAGASKPVLRESRRDIGAR